MRCPSDDELLALVEGRHGLPGELDAHIDQCSLCHSVVVAAAAAGDLDGDGGATERYRVMGEIGRGGQSRVLRVYDRELDREVALKQFLSRGDASASQGPSPADRCLREVRITGALSHPAILPIHDVGVGEEGDPYYTMPLVDGPTLSEVVGETPEVSGRLRLLPHVVQVCQAIAYAHEHGFVHRDLKPDNIMVGLFGQTLLLDWGLARVPDREDGLGVDREAEHGVTLDGSVMGTPAFMSPEQASGERDAIGPLSDVWSLGAVLYFVLCGRPPFEGDGVAQTLERVREGKARPIVADDGQVPAELAAIVVRAMATDPAARYATASALAEDLVAFQSDARVDAYSYGLVERAMRFVRRYRVFLVVLSIAFASLLTVTLVLAESNRTERRAQRQANAARQRAELASAEAQRQGERRRKESIAARYALAQAHIDTAERERAAMRPLDARLYAASALRNNPSFSGSPVFEADEADRDPSGEMIVARALGQLALGDQDHVEGVIGIRAFQDPESDPPRAGAAGGPFLGTVTAAGRATVERAVTGHGKIELATGEVAVADVEISPRGQFAATQSTDHVVRRFRLPEGTPFGEAITGANIDANFAVADDGSIVFASEAGELVVHVEGHADYRLPGSTGAREVAFSPRGEKLAYTRLPGDVVIHDVGSAASDLVVSTGEAAVQRVVFSNRGGRLAVGGTWGVVIIDPKLGVVKRKVSCDCRVNELVFSPDRYVYVVGEQNVHAIPVSYKRKRMILPLSIGLGRRIGLDGDTLYVGSSRQVQTWQLRSDEPQKQVTRKAWRATRTTATTLYRIVIGDPEVVAFEWAGQIGKTFEVPGGESLRWFAASGALRLTSAWSGRVWLSREDGDVWSPLWSREFGREDVRGLGLSEAGGIAAIGLRETIELVSVDGLAPDRSLPGHDGTARLTLRFSETGDRLVSANELGEVFSWDLRQVQPKPEVLTRQFGVRDVALDPQSGGIFVAGPFGVRFVAPGGDSRLLTTDGHKTLTLQDGLLAMLSQDAAVKIYDTNAGQVTFALPATGAPRIMEASPAPGGEAIRIVVGNLAAEIPMWTYRDADAAALLAKAERAAGYNVAGDKVAAEAP